MYNTHTYTDKIGVKYSNTGTKIGLGLGTILGLNDTISDISDLNFKDIPNDVAKDITLGGIGGSVLGYMSGKTLGYLNKPRYIRENSLSLLIKNTEIKK